VLDLSSFKLNRTDDSNFRNNYRVLSLRSSQDDRSLKRSDSSYLVKVRSDIRTALTSPNTWIRAGWAALKPLPIPPSPATSTATSSATSKKRLPPKPMTFRDLLPDSARYGRPRQEPGRIERAAGRLDQPAMMFEAERNDLRNTRSPGMKRSRSPVACLVDVPHVGAAGLDHP